MQAMIKCSICPYAADICRHFEFKSKRSLAPCEHIRIICMYRTKDMYIDVSIYRHIEKIEVDIDI